MHAGALWGCGILDYREVFDVDDEILKGRILEHACGPTAFNAEQTARGQVVLSQDALFALPHSALGECINSAAENIHVKARREGLRTFLADFTAGLREGRYRAVSELPFPETNFSFDCVLTAHSLFQDAHATHLHYHLAILLELARLAPEVRLYPLTDHTGTPALLLGPLLLALQQKNHGTEVREVRGVDGAASGAMLRIWANECSL